jgi:hypothetical protein
VTNLSVVMHLQLSEPLLQRLQEVLFPTFRALERISLVDNDERSFVFDQMKLNRQRLFRFSAERPTETFGLP